MIALPVSRAGGNVNRGERLIIFVELTEVVMVRSRTLPSLSDSIQTPAACWILFVFGHAARWRGGSPVGVLCVSY